MSALTVSISSDLRHVVVTVEISYHCFQLGFPLKQVKYYIIMRGMISSP